MGSISDPEIRTLTSLLAQIAREPIFNSLRTRDQLGIYSYFCII